MIGGKSTVMRNLKKSILRAADCSSTVLITVESGTGKELIARSIHELGARQQEPFLAINCGALTESLLESELFGHVEHFVSIQMPSPSCRIILGPEM